MSYRFIFGGSGSGKTHRIFSDCIAASMQDGADSSHFLLIVPEQASTAAEKEIVRLHPRHAVCNIDVLSFNRLAYRIFDELGMEDPNTIDDVSKAMILRKLGGEHSGELLIWADRFGRPGFTDSLKSMISELYQYGISPEELEKTAEGESFDGQLKYKLHDLSVMYRAFSEYIKGKYITAEEIPDVLSRVMHESSIIKDSVIFLDGFTGFTPIQYRIIEKFLCSAKEVVFSVSIGDESDPYSDIKKSELFEMSKEAVAKITDIAGKNGINHSPGKDIRLSSGRYFERNFMRENENISGTPDDFKAEIYTCASPDSEAEFVVSDILRHVKKENIRYRDMAVVLSDEASYAPVLKRYLDMAGVPCYMDSAVSIENNPMSLMISAAFDCINDNFSYESFVRYIKTGIISDDRRLINILDKYMFICGKHGLKKMKEDWDHIPDELKGIDREELNRFKNEIMEGILTLKAPDKTTALKKLFERYDLENKMKARAGEFAAEGNAKKAREYEKVYEVLNTLIDRLEEIIGSRELNSAEYRDILLAGISQIKLGMLPSGADRVTVGDLTRTRLENVKRLYFLGVNEGNVPKLSAGNSVLNDNEKGELKRAGLELSPTAKEDLFIQKYYLYRVLTKPEQSLCVTFACMNREGAGLHPSYIISQIEKLYPGLTAAEGSCEACDAHTELKSIALEKKFESTYAYLINKEKYSELVHMITRAALFAYKGETLAAGIPDLVYGNELSASVSKLQRYSDCPYEFFAEYGLKLKDVRAFSFETVDIGNLSHAALEKIFAYAKKHGMDLTSLDDAERDRLAEKCVKEAVLDDPASRYTDTSKSRYTVKRVTRVIKRSLWALMDIQRNGDYVPYEFEMPFRSGDGLTSMSFDLSGEKLMKLSGKIDRVDILAEGDRVGVKIMDYKSGSREWDDSDVFAGYDLQLVLYMNAACEVLAGRFPDKKITADAMYYYRLQDPFISFDKLKKGQSSEAAVLESMKPSGLSDPEKIRAIIPYVRNKAIETGNSITGGNIDVLPRHKGQNTSCSCCPYKGLCGFDKKTGGYGYAKTFKLSAKEKARFWEEIKNGMEH